MSSRFMVGLVGLTECGTRREPPLARIAATNLVIARQDLGLRATNSRT
jgi:hypothetical protein